MADEYHQLRVTTPEEFRRQFHIHAKGKHGYARVEFLASPSLEDTVYEDMKRQIDENNLARGRVDRIEKLPRIKIKYHHELLDNFNQRGKNWIAVIGPGELRPSPTYNDGEPILYQRGTNPLTLHAMNMGIPFEWGSDDDDNGGGGDDDDDDNYYENSESQR